MARPERRHEERQQEEVQRRRVEQAPRAWGPVIGGGAVAGLIAGIVMSMMAMARAMAMGAGLWFPTKQIAAMFYGVDALIGGAGVIVVGLMIHMMVSAVYGGLFAGIGGDRISAGAAFGWGLVYGIAIWLVMTWVILPIFNPVMSERVALIPAWWFGYHLIFGAMLFLTPSLYRNFAR